jgi:valyl-tRNA synthetase
MMQPQLKAKIEKLTRNAFPEGIAGYGTDALRFTFYSLASTGRDIKFDLGRTEGYRNFCNKIWNAARYVLMNCEGKIVVDSSSISLKHLSIADKWISSRFEQTASNIEEYMGNYRFDLAAQSLQEFVWNEYCDWYVELSKPVLWDEENNPNEAQATRWMLLNIMEKSLRLLHPFMPYITEEIWQRIAVLLNIQGESIMLQPYPQPDEANVDLDAEQGIEWIKGIIVAIRNIRGEMDISPAKAIPVFLNKGTASDQAKLEEYRLYLEKLAKLESIQWLNSEEEVPAVATQLYGDVEILVPMAGLIDIEAERARLEKEIAKLEAGMAAVSAKLNNKKFMENAPEAVVAKERGKAEQLSAALTALQEKLEELVRV